jgi:hypothetical protein
MGFATGKGVVRAGLKRQDNTSTGGAALHLLSKRTLCYQVSRIRTAGTLLRTHYSRGHRSARVAVRINRSAVFVRGNRAGVHSRIRGVSFLNRINIIRSTPSLSLSKHSTGITELYLVS